MFGTERKKKDYRHSIRAAQTAKPNKERKSLLCANENKQQREAQQNCSTFTRLRLNVKHVIGSTDFFFSLRHQSGSKEGPHRRRSFPSPGKPSWVQRNKGREQKTAECAGRCAAQKTKRSTSAAVKPNSSLVGNAEVALGGGKSPTAADTACSSLASAS